MRALLEHFAGNENLEVSAPGRGRGDLGEQRENVQPSIEIERFRLALRGADAVPKRTDTLHLERGRRELARVRGKPVIKLAMEGLVGLTGGASANRVGEPGDRPRIRARQIGDNGIDQRADPLLFRREASQGLANASVRALGGGS